MGWAAAVCLSPERGLPGRMVAALLAVTMLCGPARAAENEVFPDSGAKVYVREHPQTGKPFVTLGAGQIARNPFPDFKKREIRPDYGMLDANARDVPYDGPVSDRRKVYVFAATMMTLGVAGGVVTAAMPVAAAAGTGGAGTGMLAGGAVVVNAVAADIVLESKIKPGEENYVHDAMTVSAAGDPAKISFQDALRAASANASRSGS